MKKIGTLCELHGENLGASLLTDHPATEKHEYGAPFLSAPAVMRLVAHMARSWCPTIEVAIASIVLGACIVLAPHAAFADDSIDPSLIPDGTYPAHVERIISPKRLEVTMQGTLRVFLGAGRPSIIFTDKIKPNDDISVTLTDGKVTAFSKKS